jgi:UDP-N-acetylglucosamine 2-epimerase (non-hydrolysing)/UDP-GlcNAc3NAcA epimerase
VTAGDYALVTAHRAGNVDDPARLEQLVAILEALPLPAVLPLHPRTAARLDSTGLRARLDSVPHLTLTDPLGYLDFTALLVSARVMLTDSGGVQKEAYLAGVPCVTLRDTTEWVETVAAGWNVLVDLDAEATLAALDWAPPADRPQLYGDGEAGERVVVALTAA